MNFKKFMEDWIVPLAVALVLYVVVRNFVFYKIKVPSESMFPAIKVGDNIIVTPILNRKNLQRGDIIEFYFREKDEELIKRLIGLPGDTVKVTEDGQVFVNGTKLQENYVVFNGGKGGDFKVPEGHYLFLGDNRANSFDSRYWQEPYIDAKDLKSKARFIVFPFNRIGKLK